MMWGTAMKSEDDDEEMLKSKEEERKINTRVYNCEKAFATERMIMDLPYEVVHNTCVYMCFYMYKLRLFDVYRSNKFILQTQWELVFKIYIYCISKK